MWVGEGGSYLSVASPPPPFTHRPGREGCQDRVLPSGVTEPLLCWQYLPLRVTASRPPRETESVRIRGALAAAHALALELRLRWETGPRGGVFLSLPRRGPGPTWVDQVLGPSYPQGRWRPVPEAAPGRTDRSDVVRYGIAFGPAVGSLATDDPLPWCEPVLRCLAGLPIGGWAEWTLRPLAGGVLSAEPSPSLAPVPPGFRTSGSTGPERERADRRERRRLGPWWQATLVVQERSAGFGSPPPLGALVVAAASSARDRGLRLVPPHPLWRRHPPSLWIGAAEMAGLWPGSDTAFATEATGSPAEGRFPFARGFDGTPIDLPWSAAEGRHLLLVGETGMGKSTALVRLAREAIEHGAVVLFDPIGDTARELIGRLPTPAARRSIWVAPHVSPAAIDLIGAIRTSGADRLGGERALGNLVEVLRRVRSSRYESAPFWGPRIEEMVRLALAAAAALPGGTLGDADRLLASASLRVTTVPPAARAAVDALRERVQSRPEEVDGTRRLLRELTSRATLVSMLGDPRASLAPTDLVRDRALSVVSGEAPHVGETDARYLLSVHLALFWSARLASKQPPKTFLVLDEVQWFANEALAEMLRLGRRTNLHLWMTTQSLAALPDAVREAIRTNVADLVVFRGSPEEARDLSRLAPQLPPERLWSLARGEAAVFIGKGERVALALVPGLRPIDADVRSRAQAEVLRASARYWVVDDPLRRPTEAESPSTVAAESVGAPRRNLDDRLRQLALVLWAGWLDRGEEQPLEVDLGRLRSAADPEGTTVRALGRELGQRGLLVESGRDGAGGRWTVARPGFEALIGGSVDPKELARATDVWREVTLETGVPTRHNTHREGPPSLGR